MLTEEDFSISSAVNFNVFTRFHKVSKNKQRLTQNSN